MVPGQLSLSEREQNLRADCRLQEETSAALHSSYDQWDPCGEGEQLQVPRCKHLRGPDLDCTHSNTGQKSQPKTVPSATAEEIQGLTSNPKKTFYSGAIESVLTQCISVWYSNATNRHTLSGAHLWVCPPLSAGHLPQTLQKQSCKNNQGFKSPR